MARPIWAQLILQDRSSLNDASASVWRKGGRTAVSPYSAQLELLFRRNIALKLCGVLQRCR